MKKLLQIPLWFLLLGAVVLCKQPATEVGASQGSVVANNTSTTATTVYVVRHAEKDVSNPTDQDPDLSAEGKARADSLRELLQDVELGGLYATKYIRTKNTLKPLSEERKLEISEYKTNDFVSLKRKLLQEHLGQTVVVAGHSNTLLPLIEALGAKPKISFISETEYDYIFKVTMVPDKASTLEVSQYSN
ncbi:histidine phosphatase family protein [Pontibacter sp. 13R65]|uniref:histidine phosphatase family protein n=1 Tax=Pontibacter sp. 13R65 TaxID=3127458 RepID=UPI00301BA7F1